jgi:hypothetical protein
MMKRAVVVSLGSAAVLLLAACASDGPAPIVISGAAGSQAATGSAALPGGLVSYQRSGELPPLDSDAPGYRAAGSGATAADAERIAAALGLSAPAATATGWTVAEPDGRTLTVSNGALGDWQYGQAIAVACAEPEGAVGDGDCADPAPGQPPTDAAAIAAAEALLAEIGEPADQPPQVERDAFGVSVIFPRELAGITTPYSPTVRFSDGTAVESGTGYLGSFDEAGQFPRIGTDAAFALLQSGQAVPWLPAVSQPVADGALPGPAGEPVAVQITGVAEGLWTLYGADGSTWLVPSYVFLDADGGEYPVPAIPEDLVDVEPSPILPLPADDPATSSVQ